MKNTYMLCFTVCFFTTCFGMKKEVVPNPENYEVKIMDEYKLLSRCVCHCNAKITINDDQNTHVITLHPERRVEEGSFSEYWKSYWEKMSLSHEQLKEIKTRKSTSNNFSKFYLYAYQKKGEIPFSCVEITQIDIIENNQCSKMQLESPQAMVQRQYWRTPSLGTILLYGALPFILIYNLWAYWKK